MIDIFFLIHRIHTKIRTVTAFERFLSCSAIVCFVFALSLEARVLHAESTALDDRETKIFAAAVFYVVKFTRSDSWISKEKISICVLASGNEKETIQELFSNSESDRNRYGISDKLSSCNVIYFGRGYDTTDERKILERERGLPVLSIGHSDQFLEQGGTVLLREESNKLRIYLRRGVVQEKLLKFSSEFLAIVHEFSKED